MRIVIGTLLSLMFATGVAFAQAPAAQPAAPAKMSTGQKKAISKSCSDQATAKGLHGRARKKFRADCKKNGGNPPQ
ncbi:MAG TPA: PsiF family protein [Xanthobacteraceae bacterium]|nr:PsiF family protein [Xanthobacteraceae bacterium]